MNTTSQGIPRNLQELLDRATNGYVLKQCYLLRLKHDLWGFFPALVGDSKRIVVTADLHLIHDVWKIMSPRRSELIRNNYYVNEALGVGFPVLGSDQHSNEESEPFELLQRAEFEALTAENPQPFRWAPGLVSNDMNDEEFAQTLDAAISRLQPRL